MPLKRAVTEFGKTYKDRFALRTYPGTSVPIFIFILGWSRTKPRVTLSAQTMVGKISRTARCKTLKAALEIRAAWAKERDELEANAAKVTPSGGKAAFRIERHAVTVVFD